LTTPSERFWPSRRASGITSRWLSGFEPV
jgi:hypothetical protein